MVNLLVRGIVMKVQLFLIVKSDVKENAMKNIVHCINYMKI